MRERQSRFFRYIHTSVRAGEEDRIEFMLQILLYTSVLSEEFIYIRIQQPKFQCELL